VTRSTPRRAAALLAGVAIAAGLLASGCSAGQIAETAKKKPSVPGRNVDGAVRDDTGAVIGRVSLRDVVVVYRDPKGFPAGGEAPLQVAIFNDTPEAVRVRVTSPAGAPGEEGTVGAKSVELAGAGAEPTSQPAPPSPSASGSPSAPPTPTTPPARPAIIEIPADSFAVLGPNGERWLKLVGLDRSLAPGASVRLMFEFDNGTVLRLTAPVATPLTAGQRATPAAGEGEGGH